MMTTNFVSIGTVVRKTSGIGADLEWKLVGADPDGLKLKSINEPNLKWIGTFEEFNAMFVSSAGIDETGIYVPGMDESTAYTSPAMRELMSHKK